MELSIVKKYAYLAIFTLAWLSLGMAILRNGWFDTWKTLHIPSMVPPLADMRTVQGAILRACKTTTSDFRS
jgi:hypothetical protein